VTLPLMEYVTKRQEEDVTVKLLVHYFLRFHEHGNLVKGFGNHQDERNLLS
jgi:hypothetical protein